MDGKFHSFRQVGSFMPREDTIAHEEIVCDYLAYGLWQYSGVLILPLEDPVDEFLSELDPQQILPGEGFLLIGPDGVTHHIADALTVLDEMGTRV